MLSLGEGAAVKEQVLLAFALLDILIDSLVVLRLYLVEVIFIGAAERVVIKLRLRRSLQLLLDLDVVLRAELRQNVPGGLLLRGREVAARLQGPALQLSAEAEV